MVLAKNRIMEILEEIHSEVGGWHFEINKTLQKVRDRFYWVECRSLIVNLCMRCCYGSAIYKSRMYAIVAVAFEKIPFDVAYSFPVTDSGYIYLGNKGLF